MVDPLTDKDLERAERWGRMEEKILNLDKEVIKNGLAAQTGIEAISSKLDALDVKWDARFEKLETAQSGTSEDLATFKAKGAGVLAAVGVIFTATATIFSDFFMQLKHLITG